MAKPKFNKKTKMYLVVDEHGQPAIGFGDTIILGYSKSGLELECYSDERTIPVEVVIRPIPKKPRRKP